LEEARAFDSDDDASEGKRLRALWASVLWPVYFVARLKRKRRAVAAPDDATGPTGTALRFDARDIVALRASIAEALAGLDEHDGVAHGLMAFATPLETMLRSLDDEEKHGPSTRFEAAACCADAALRSAHSRLLPDVTHDALPSPISHTTTVPVVAHLATNTDIPGSFQPVGHDMGELMLVSMHPYPRASADLLPALFAEAAESIHSTDAGDIDGFSRGVFFAAEELGIACLATSLVPELGATVSTDGRHITIDDTKADAFFDVAFFGGGRATSVGTAAEEGAAGATGCDAGDHVVDPFERAARDDECCSERTVDCQ
jgi:hypothetical protein